MGLRVCVSYSAAAGALSICRETDLRLPAGCRLLDAGCANLVGLGASGRRAHAPPPVMFGQNSIARLSSPSMGWLRAGGPAGPRARSQARPQPAGPDNGRVRARARGRAGRASPTRPISRNYSIIC